MNMIQQSASPTRSTRAAPAALAAIDGQIVNVSGISEAVRLIVNRLALDGSFFVCTLNLDHLVKRRHDVEFRKAYEKAEIVTADGFPVAALARLRGRSIRRAPGSDLVMPLCAAAASRRLPIFLLGTTLQALCATAQQLVSRYPDLEICGAYAPPSGFEAHSQAADEAIAIIRDSGAHICFVALGAPRQEMFAARAIEETSNVAFVAVGGGLDFIAGAQIRCPLFIRSVYLEWAWRLMLNPRRLGPRYLRCALLLLVLLVQTGINRQTVTAS